MSKTFMQLCRDKHLTIRRFGEALHVTRNEANNIIHLRDWTLIGKHKQAICDLLELDEAGYQAMVDATNEEEDRRWEKGHPAMTAEQSAVYDLQMSDYARRIWAGMGPEARQRVHKKTVEMGFSKPDTRSPIDRMIDQACGRDE